MDNITVLLENLVYNEGLRGEHGLSFYIEFSGKKILFDTGQSDIFLENAKFLNINLKEIDYLVISHGHYDHCGGISGFLEINDKAKIILKKNSFEKKYSNSTGVIREIGMGLNLEEYNNRIIFVDDLYKIDENISIIGKFVNKQDFENEEKKLMVKKDGKYLIDQFEDELILIVKKEDKLKVITACSHNGIVNIIKSIEKLMGKKIEFLIGGFHLKNSSDERIKKTIDFLLKADIERLCVNHCTGIEVYNQIKTSLDKKVDYAYTGKKYNL